MLIKYFQHKYTDTINKSDSKNPFCRLIAVCVNIKSKKNGIGQQAKCTGGSDQFIIVEEKIKKLNKGKAAEITGKEIDRDQSE